MIVTTTTPQHNEMLNDYNSYWRRTSQHNGRMFSTFDKVNFHIFDKVILFCPLLNRELLMYHFTFHQTNTYQGENTGYFFNKFVINKKTSLFTIKKIFFGI